MRQFDYTIDGERVVCSCEGDTVWGKNEILFEQDDGIIGNTRWGELGYVVAPVLDVSEWDALRRAVISIVQQEVEQVLNHPIPNFEIEKYHRYIDNAQHFQIVKSMIKIGLPTSRVPFSVERFNEFVSEMSDADLEVRQAWEKPWGPRISSIRLVRPGHTDCNPLHRDSWSDPGRNIVNVYVPIAGSNERSSLSLIPKSHLWNEVDVERSLPGKSIIDGIKFSVGCAVNSTYGLHMTRPNPQSNEIMVFTPYAIHGGARNFNDNLTRVSLEMRFQRKGSPNPIIVGGGTY